MKLKLVSSRVANWMRYLIRSLDYLRNDIYVVPVVAQKLADTSQGIH